MSANEADNSRNFIPLPEALTSPLAQLPARIGRPLATGADMWIAAAETVKLIAEKSFKEEVNANWLKTRVNGRPKACRGGPASHQSGRSRRRFLSS